MSSLLRSLLAAATVLLVTGCETIPTYHPPVARHGESIKTLEIVIDAPERAFSVSPGRGVDVVAMPGPGVAAGPAVAISVFATLVIRGIESAVAASIERDLAAINAQVKAVDLRASLLRELDSVSVDAVLPSARHRVLERPLAENVYRDYAVRSDADAVAFVRLRSGFWVGMDEPLLTADVRVYDRGGSLVAQDKAVFRGPRAPGETIEVRRKWWESDARYRHFVSHGLRAMSVAMKQEVWRRRAALDEPSRKALGEWAERADLAAMKDWRSDPCIVAADEQNVHYVFRRTPAGLFSTGECGQAAAEAQSTEEALAASPSVAEAMAKVREDFRIASGGAESPYATAPGSHSRATTDSWVRLKPLTWTSRKFERRSGLVETTGDAQAAKSLSP
jgi:hypothetical protein